MWECKMRALPFLREHFTFNIDPYGDSYFKIIALVYFLGKQSTLLPFSSSCLQESKNIM